MLVLVLTTAFEGDPAAYPLLLVATGLLGAGFGLTVPVLNTYAAAFQPDRADRAVLTLNALLGLGTALAPVFVAVFVGLGFWWGLPVLSTVLLVLLLLAAVRACRCASRRLSPSGAGGTRRHPVTVLAVRRVRRPLRHLRDHERQLVGARHDASLGASTTQAALALTAFWAMVTVGRLLFAAIGRWLPPRTVFRVLPLVLVGTFALTAALSDVSPARGSWSSAWPGWVLRPAAAGDQPRPGRLPRCRRRSREA